VNVVKRWTRGHHGFAIFAIAERAALLGIERALHDNDDAKVAANLRVAAVLRRAIAAAQWYASDFPLAVYRDVLRPTMEQAGTRIGFSGTLNADYARLKQARETAVEALFATYGSDGSSWPPDVYAALEALHEMEVQAAEHHVLVAASKVDVDQSLAQKAAGTTHESAVDVLREIVDATVTDLTDRFTGAPVAKTFACKAADVPEEQPHGVRVNGKDLIVCRAYGAFWATDAYCTHADADLSGGHMAGDCIVCPLHGSKFDPRTGAALRAPAKDALGVYPVVVEGDDLFVEM
jgi:nitrite reductase/ring-hydroxylating ferredoxin subunit